MRKKNLGGSGNGDEGGEAQCGENDDFGAVNSRFGNKAPSGENIWKMTDLMTRVQLHIGTLKNTDHSEPHTNLLNPPASARRVGEWSKKDTFTSSRLFNGTKCDDYRESRRDIDVDSTD